MNSSLWSWFYKHHLYFRLFQNTAHLKVTDTGYKQTNKILLLHKCFILTKHENSKNKISWSTLLIDKIVNKYDSSQHNLIHETQRTTMTQIITERKTQTEAIVISLFGLFNNKRKSFLRWYRNHFLKKDKTSFSELFPQRSFNVGDRFHKSKFPGDS